MPKRMTNIVSYLSIVGVIIAFLFGSRHESRFHILQSFELVIAFYLARHLPSMIGNNIVGVVLSLVCSILSLIIFIIWIVALKRAISGKDWCAPVLGRIAKGILAKVDAHRLKNLNR